ncbi:MAG: hypothetical protein E7425_03980, partial [Ruminococcaceae bacterium]|nr:hypothetical protein [Oscillospiraceae bacterium]
MKHTSKPLSILLTICMLVGLVPWAALPARAEDDETGTFTELQALLDAAESGGRVTLDRDYARGGSDSSTLVIAEDKTVTLDLNGHVIKGSSGASVISVSGDLTLTDSRPAFAGTESEPRASVTYTSSISQKTATVTGGVITGGKSSLGSGGGVYVYSSGRLTMNGGTICGCQAPESGGVCVYGEFNMYGGAVSGNSATRSTGSGGSGGVCVYGKFNMYGGAVSGNAAGNIYNYTGKGGGVYVCDAAFTMNGGTISGNTANGYLDCGGVYLGRGGAFKVSGGARIIDNVKGGTIEGGVLSGGTPNNVYLREGSTIAVTDALTGGEGCIGVTLGDYYGTGAFTSDLAKGGTNAIKCFASDADGYAVKLSGGEAALAVEYSVANGRVTAPAGAVLILATYNASGRLTSSQTATVGEDCVNATPASLGITLPTTGTWKLML